MALPVHVSHVFMTTCLLAGFIEFSFSITSNHPFHCLVEFATILETVLMTGRTDGQQSQETTTQ